MNTSQDISVQTSAIFLLGVFVGRYGCQAFKLTYQQISDLTGFNSLIVSSSLRYLESKSFLKFILIDGQYTIQIFPFVPAMLSNFA